MPQTPLQTFIIYAHDDRHHKDALVKALKISLVQAGKIRLWHDDDIPLGAEWHTAIKKNLAAADLVLVLVSTHSLASEYINTTELNIAFDRLREGVVRVVPIILDHCPWEFNPVLKGLQGLPQDMKPVSDHANQNQVWTDIIRKLNTLVEQKWQDDADQAAVLSKIFADEEREKAAEEQKKQAAAAQKERILEQQRILRQDWADATATDSIAAYEQFLKKYPDTEHTTEARYRLKELRRANRRPLPWKTIATAIGLPVLLLAAWGLWSVMKKEKPLADPVLQPETAQNQPQTEQEKSKLTIINADIEDADFDFNYPMVRVQGGTFLMGSPESEKDRKKNECQHSVTVGNFGVGKYEVTQAQWRQVMGSDPAGLYNKGCDQCPVEMVSWDDVQAFIKKLNAATGLRYRLPTEAEWEYAAKGGNQSRNYIYAGGNDLGTVAWYSGNAKNGNTFGSQKTTRPVGGKQPNELGIFDMSGNVWEWCADVWAPYPCDNSTNDIGLSACSLRGGSWDDDSDCRSSVRARGFTSIKGYGGFRLAQD